MVKIHFSFVSHEFQIEPVDYPLSKTLADIYQYVKSCIGDQYEPALSYDQCNVLPSDDTPLMNLIQEGEECILFVSTTEKIQVNVLFDGQQLLSKYIDCNTKIEDFVNQVTTEIYEDSQIAEYQLLDENGGFLLKIDSIQLPFESYIQGANTIGLNLIRGQVEPKQENEEVPQANIVYEQQSLSDYKDPLAQLVVFKNFTLLIDPLGNFVAYKFHQPLIMEGKLQKILGKPLNPGELKWIEKNKIKYAKINDFGFAIKWDNDTYSSIQLQ